MVKGDWGNVPRVLGVMFSFNSIKGEMNGKWEMFYIFFIEVDLWLILFLKGQNNGGMGCVPIPIFVIY